MTLLEALDAWLAQYRVSLTRSAYRGALARFCEAGGISTLDDLRAVKAQDLPELVSRVAGSPATIQQTLSAVRSLYRHLRLEDPTIGFRGPTIGDNVPDWNVLHPGDSQLVLDHLTDPHQRAVLLALVLQGWRVTELCRLTWGQVRQDREHGWVVEWRGKRNKLRTQGIQAAVLEAIQALGEPPAGAKRARAPLLPHPSGRAWTRFEVYNLVTRAGKAAGRRITPHGLRATYISSVISRKGIEAARQLAGHSSLDTTSRYSRWQIVRDDPLTVEDL